MNQKWFIVGVSEWQPQKSESLYCYDFAHKKWSKQIDATTKLYPNNIDSTLEFAELQSSNDFITWRHCNGNRSCGISGQRYENDTDFAVWACAEIGGWELENRRVMYAFVRGKVASNEVWKSNTEDKKARRRMFRFWDEPSILAVASAKILWFTWYFYTWILSFLRLCICFTPNQIIFIKRI